MHGQSGQHHGQDERSGSRHRRDRNACLNRSPHQGEAGVGDTGRAGFGHQRNTLPLLQKLDDMRARALFVVLVERNLVLLEAEVLQKEAGLSGVLARDDVDVAAESPPPAA